MTPYTNEAINNFLNANTEQLYFSLHNLVNFQLNEMNYLIPESFQSDVKDGLESGDYYLKICGAGGGGYMLGFTEKWEATQEKLAGKDLEILYRF